jgi:hypothetical protein
MLDFERALFAAGWHSNIHDMEWALQQYDAVTRSPRTIEHLPSPYPYYEGKFTLNICWAERGSSSLFDLRNIQAQRMGWVNENNFYDQREPIDAGDVFRKVTQEHRYIVAIAIKGHYFEN